MESHETLQSYFSPVQLVPRSFSPFFLKYYLYLYDNCRFIYFIVLVYMVDYADGGTELTQIKWLLVMMRTIKARGEKQPPYHFFDVDEDASALFY